MFGSPDITRRIIELNVVCWVILNHTLKAGGDDNPVPVGIGIDSLYTADQTAMEGDSVTLRCDISPHNAVIGERHWKKDDELIISSASEPDNPRFTLSKPYTGSNNLTISKVLRSDAGSYECIVEDTSTGQSFRKKEICQLTVYYMDKPEPVYQLNVIVLQCPIESSHPEVNNCIWKFNNKDIDQNSERHKFYDSNCRMEIEDSTPDDEGKYECRGENGILFKVSDRFDVTFPTGSTSKGFSCWTVVAIFSTIILLFSCSLIVYKFHRNLKNKIINIIYYRRIKKQSDPETNV